MRSLLAVAAGLAGVTHDGQGSQCAAAYEQEFATAGSTYAFDIPSDGCYRVDLFLPACDYAPGALDVHYCKGRVAQVAAGLDVKGWVPVGVWPFYVANGGSLEFHGSHDAARVVRVSDLSEHGCQFAEPRLAAVHLPSVEAGAELEAALAEWGDAVVHGIDLSKQIVHLELRRGAVIGALAPLCAAATGCTDCAECVREAEVFVQEHVGDVRQVETADQRVQLQATAPMAPGTNVQVLPAATTFDAGGEHCPAAYGKQFSPSAKEVEFQIPEDGCYRVEVHQPRCAMAQGALDVHYCKGMTALGLQPQQDLQGWVPVGVWPFYSANGGKFVQHGAHDAARLVFAGPLSRGCRFEAPRLARVHLKAPFSRVTDAAHLAARAEKVLHRFGPMKVLGVSEGSVVLDVELSAGANAESAEEWIAPLCDLVEGGPECVDESTVTITGFDGLVEREVKTESGSAMTQVAAVLLGWLACAGVGYLVAKKARAWQKPPAVEPTDVEAAAAPAPHAEDVKPPQDDDLCSTATPSTVPDLDQSLQSGKYSCGKTSLGVSTVVC
jgi:hypothetical protein